MHYRSTQHCIPPGLLNLLPASAGVKTGLSPLPCGRWSHMAGEFPKAVRQSFCKLLYTYLLIYLLCQSNFCQLLRSSTMMIFPRYYSCSVSSVLLLVLSMAHGYLTADCRLSVILSCTGLTFLTGSFTSFRVPTPPGKSWISFCKISRPWKVLENGFGRGKSWKF